MPYEENCFESTPQYPLKFTRISKKDSTKNP